MKHILENIKTSKKYKNLDENIIKQKIEKIIKKYPKAKDKFIIKQVKTELHKTTGFSIRAGKQEKLLSSKQYEKFLETNRSTKERFKDYPNLYKKIFQITNKPKSILDLGSGINPISIIYMDIKPVYYAYDVNKSDIKLVNQFFKQESIKGKAEVLNLNNINNIKKLEKSDICFLFKAVDVLESKGHKYTEQIIKNLKCEHVVISFATKTLGGKKMRYAGRGWIERMLERLNIKYDKFEISNEVFYVIKKSS